MIHKSFTTACQSTTSWQKGIIDQVFYAIVFRHDCSTTLSSQSQISMSYNFISSIAGRPPPDVSWYRGEERLTLTKEGSVSQLHIPSLSREMVGTRLQCRVDPPLMQPMFRDVTLKLYCKYCFSDCIKYGRIMFYEYLCGPLEPIGFIY